MSESSKPAAHLEVPASVRSVLTPPEDLLPHQWVEKYRRLHEKDAAESGAFSFDKIPYMVEPTDAVADPTVRSITLIKASRCSGTELINNVAAWSIDCRPMPAIYVLPRADDVDEEFKGRLKRIVEASPKLAAHVPGGNWATEEAISLDTMTIMSAACTRAGDFIRRTSGLNLFDEVDNCSEEAMKSRLGDVWTLLEERITTFGYRGKQLGVSTPTTTEGSGWKAYQASDRRRYFCPCPRCGTYQVLQFEQIRLAEAHELERDSERIILGGLARYVCENPACAAALPESDKLWMTTRGVWVPHTQKIVGRLEVESKELAERAHFRTPAPHRFVPPVEGEVPVTRRRGYWVDAAVSPWRTFSEFLAKFFATKDDPAPFKVFWTHWRALPWQEAKQSTDPGDLKAKVETGHAPDTVPARAVLLIGDVDVQAHWLYFNLWAFGPGEEAWLVKHGTAETFEEVEEICLDRVYPYEDATDPDDAEQGLRGSFLGYDTGYRTSDVYDRWLLRPAEIVLHKGWDTLPEKWKPAHIEYYPTGRRNPHSIRLFHLNTGFFKEKLHGLFKRPGDGPGTLHLHRETSQAYLDQVTAEHYVYRKPKKGRGRGKWSWEPRAEGRANHYGDTLVGAFAIADMKNARTLPKREVLAARRSQLQQQQQSPAAGGIRMPDGRSFLSINRR